MAYTEEQRRSALKRAKAQYEMYEKTKKETKREMKKKVNKDGSRVYSDEDIESKIKLIDEAEKEFLAQFQLDGGDINELSEIVKKKTLLPSESMMKVLRDTNADDEAIRRAINNIKETNEDVQETPQIDISFNETETKLEQEYLPHKGEYDPEAAFDVIPLPSKGEGYKDKISKATVAYLTAYDENMILSPNLYKQNMILDYLIQEKLLSKQIDPMDLLEGDREAIILFLRASGYGNEYPITATDDATGKEFDTVVDLSKLKYKEFNLKGDSNGWFTYVLPVSQKEVKFRFPTHRDVLILEKLEKSENNLIKKATISSYAKELDEYIDDDKKVSTEEKIKLRQAVNALENWSDNMEDTELLYNHSITNRFNLLIMAVDGITDKAYISNFIKKMNVKDSYMLRKYMTDNKPGIDYTITVNRPQSLGGGSFTTFLQLDELLFLNIPY
jgi:hypothetical protein